jgi:hypothetical protein
VLTIDLLTDIPMAAGNGARSICVMADAEMAAAETGCLEIDAGKYFKPLSARPRREAVIAKRMCRAN